MEPDLATLERYWESMRSEGLLDERLTQTWCPSCEKTIIDPVVERVCVQCENLTNGGSDGSEA